VPPGQLNGPAEQAIGKPQAVSLSAVTGTTCSDNNNVVGSSTVGIQSSYILLEAMIFCMVYL